ncbi:MAG: carboxypeptidase-like regulatory domain-containing protein [Steroidobacteraceae bacterium]
MDPLNRQRLVLGLALIVCLALLGRWAISPDEAANARPDGESPTTVASPPAKAQLPSLVEATSDVAPYTGKSASAFGTLRGRVIDAITRKAVHEFEVQFQGTQPTKVGDEAPGARTFRTVDGRFEWEYLPPGTWTFTASASGYQRFEFINLDILKGEATPEVVLPLRAGHRLHGRVYDEASGAGIAAASIAFREAGKGRFEGNFRSRVRVTSAKNGSFELHGVPPGRVTLEISAQDYAGQELEIIVSDETSPFEVGLSLGGTIAGRLTAADGITPVAGTVGLFNLDQGFGGTGRTGEAGEFSFPHLGAGRYQLTGQAGNAATEQEVVLANNQRMEGIVLALSAARSIRGMVTGLRPEDLKRTSISLRRDGDAGNPYGEVGVDVRGAYVLQGVQPGRVQVVADVTMRRQLSKTVEVPADSDITVNLDFPSGARLSGRVTRGGKPLSGVWLTPRPAVEQRIYVYGTSTSKEGTYVMEDLATGEYVVFVGEYKSRTVEILGDTVFDIDVPLAQLSGRVFEEGGKVPIVGAEVDLWPAELGSPQIRLHDRSDHFGQFALAGLESGDFMLTAYKPGFEMFRERFSYASPVADMTIRLRQNAGVAIRVRDARSGKPVHEIIAIEMLGNRNGSRLQLHLDENGIGNLPSALTGSTISFWAYGHGSTIIHDWSGQPLDLQLQPQKAQ